MTSKRYYPRNVGKAFQQVLRKHPTGVRVELYGDSGSIVSCIRFIQQPEFMQVMFTHWRDYSGECCDSGGLLFRAPIGCRKRGVWQ